MKHLTLFAALLALSTLGASADGVKTLKGHVPQAAAHATPLGRAEPGKQIHLNLGLPLRNAEGLKALLDELYDPNSPAYHQFLSPDQFADRFGPSPADYQAVQAFAQQHGLQVQTLHANRMVLDVCGSVSNIEAAFSLHLNNYRHPSETRTCFAPDREPTIDARVPIQDIQGLSDFAKPRPAGLRQKPIPHAGSASSGEYMGSDFRNAYAPGVSLRGTGQKVGLLEFDGYYASDIASYLEQAGLTNVPLSNVLLDGFDGTPGINDGEVALDIEMAISMAPGLAEIVVYETDSGCNSMLSMMACDTAINQFSSSWTWGTGPDATTDQLFLELAAQGQSFFQASGDSGAYSGDIDTPADNPYITIVGGTTLTTTSAGAWSSETTWNWDDGWGSGGGISTCYPIPIWQQGFATAANNASPTMRNIPDVALTADNVFIVADNGQNEDVGGTSCAAPLWAAFTALANEQAQSLGQTVGFINPVIYPLAQSSSYAACFHDITTGNNGWFNAEPGYDLCTGLGTPAGQPLIDALVAAATSPPTGSGGLQVFINPSAAAGAGATWAVDGGSNNTSGAVVAPLSAGYHVISYTPAPGWAAPDIQVVTIPNGATNVVTGFYTATQTGSIEAVILPEAAQSAARWQVDGGSPQSGNATASGMNVGYHTVEFLSSSNWLAPAPVNVFVAANRTAVAQAMFTKASHLTVTLSPVAATSAGAGWKLDGGAVNSNGATVAGIAAGWHTVTFTSVPSWVTPATHKIRISTGQNAQLKAVYTTRTGRYWGLFCNSNDVALENAGSLQIQLAASREFSGKLSFANTNYSITGQLSRTGLICKQVGNWQLSGQITGTELFGTLSNALDGAAVYAYDTPTSPNPSCPEAGTYTLGITASQSASLGTARLAISRQGVISFAGALTDGTKVTQSAPMSAKGEWPLFIPLDKGRSLLVGWLELNNITNAGIEGNAYWIHPATNSDPPAPGATLTEPVTFQPIPSRHTDMR
jgi:hypothetical protein